MNPQLGVSSVDAWVLGKIHQALGRPPIRLSAGTGAVFSPATTPPLAELAISDRATLWRLILDPEVAFGDAYATGHMQVKGDLVSMLEALVMVIPEPEQQSWWSRAVLRWMSLIQANSLSGSRGNIHQHYDLGNEFYRLWLDPEMAYTCAYYPSPSASLEQAQIGKMEYVCRKLQLRPGERVVEAGCGWGAMALYMARHYGVSVRAFNISSEQIAWCRQRAQELGLNDRVEFLKEDYRNISGHYDAFVSVGMVEHVGQENLAELGRVIASTLNNSGRGLLHFIGRNRPRPLNPWIRKHIFPGAYLPAVREVLQHLEPWDFSVLDVENLRPHYARTLEQWLERFEKSADAVSRMYGPEFTRTWRLYLAAALAGFRTGKLQLFQVVFARPACHQIPWTRAHLYEKSRWAAPESVWTRATS
jgi:cyclopropane-fatty-acyl-phospholipid synthase